MAAAASRMTVLSGGTRSTAVSTDGRPLERDNSNALGVRANVVSRRYFETMNIPILHGRSFNASDGPKTTRRSRACCACSPARARIRRPCSSRRMRTPARRRRPRPTRSPRGCSVAARWPPPTSTPGRSSPDSATSRWGWC